jgi:hypothetical protein
LIVYLYLKIQNINWKQSLFLFSSPGNSLFSLISYWCCQSAFFLFLIEQFWISFPFLWCSNCCICINMSFNEKKNVIQSNEVLSKMEFHLMSTSPDENYSFFFRLGNQLYLVHLKQSVENT